jgi:hypothetical protein
MCFYKRALARRVALWLGLFFCFVLPLGAQEDSIPAAGEVSAETGTLWVEDDGAAWYWHSGLELTLGEYFFLGIDLGQVSANLPWADGSVFGFMWRYGIDTPRGGFTLAVGSLSHSLVSAAADKVVISNDGGDGFCFSIETPLRFGPLSLAPYLLYGEASWDNGDLYWFFGKPKLPFLLIYGADFSLDQQGRYKHTLGSYGFSADIRIISNEDEPLFDTNLNAGLFFYQFSREEEKLVFTGTLGWFFTRASLEGALTSSNQPYFLFPFSFYNINAGFEIQAGFAGFRFRHSLGIFQYGFNLGALHIFYDRGGVDIHYRMKRLFGGDEAFDEINPDLSGLGAAFFLLEAAFPALPLTRKLRLSLDLQKAFVVPWGYEKLLASDNDSPAESPSAADTRSLLKTALLSGLSIHGSLSW